MITQIFNICAYDDYALDVRLCLPENEQTDKIILFINGSGPQTYTTRRQLPDGSFFHYFDIWAEEFTSRNIGFCSYSQRGVRDGDAPPFFVEIDESAYRQYLPHNSIADIESIAAYLNKAYPMVRIIFLGWSEGTILAPLVARNGNVEVSALMLAGYCNENLRDILAWQLSGNHILLQWRRLFDYDRKGYITQTDFAEDRLNVKNTVFGERTFSDLDRDGDGRITISDTLPLTIDHYNKMLQAIDHDDDEWLKHNHGVRLTSGWFKEHFALAPTKEILPLLDLPIHIFAGEYDAMTPIKQAKAIAGEFNRLGKTNLCLHTFQDHDHDLNFVKYLLKNEHSEGMQSILDIAEKL